MTRQIDLVLEWLLTLPPGYEFQSVEVARCTDISESAGNRVSTILRRLERYGYVEGYTPDGARGRTMSWRRL